MAGEGEAVIYGRRGIGPRRLTLGCFGIGPLGLGNGLGALRLDQRRSSAMRVSVPIRCSARVR
jgi:hypothetical protein